MVKGRETRSNSIELKFDGKLIELCGEENGSKCFKDNCRHMLKENKRYWLKFPENVSDVSTSFACGFINALWDATWDVDYGKYFNLFHPDADVSANIKNAFEIAKGYKECSLCLKEKTKNNEYFANKEKNKMKMRLNKVEREIAEKEKEINEIQIEMTKEEVFSDYIKLTDFQKRLEELNEELTVVMAEWENLILALEL